MFFCMFVLEVHEGRIPVLQQGLGFMADMNSPAKQVRRNNPETVNLVDPLL